MTDHSDLIAKLRACATARTGENPYQMLSQAADALSSQSLSLSEARAENERLRAALAQSDLPCAYCSLPKDEWAKCASGFPGCDRADDAMGCPELGARLSIESATRQRDEALEALNIARDYVVDAEADGDREIDSVRSYPGLMMQAKGRRDEVRKDLAKIDAALGANPVLENSKARLADANSNPGTEQREAGV